VRFNGRGKAKRRQDFFNDLFWLRGIRFKNMKLESRSGATFLIFHPAWSYFLFFGAGVKAGVAPGAVLIRINLVCTTPASVLMVM